MKKNYLILLLTLNTIFAFSQNAESNLKVQIGMSIDDVKNIYQDCNFKTVPAWQYGIDGGGEGVEVSRNNSPLFFVVFNQKSNNASLIVVVSKQIYFDGFVRTGIEFEKYLSKYPKSKPSIDLITDYEFCYNQDKNYIIEFMTSENNRIADYSTEFGEPEFVKIINANYKIDRIILKK